MDVLSKDLRTAASLTYVLIMSFLAVTIPYYIALYALATTLLISIVCLRRYLIKALIYLIAFILPFTILTIIIQLIIGSNSPDVIVSYLVRISIIYLNSMILVRVTSMSSLIRILSKLNCELALSTAIAFKLLIDGSKLINELKAIYEVNLCSKSCNLRLRLQVLKSVTYAISKLLTMEVLRTAEVIYIRYYARICLRD